MAAKSARIPTQSQRTAAMMSFTPPKTVSRSGSMASASSNWVSRISRSRSPRMARFAYSSGSSWVSAICCASRSAQPRYPPFSSGSTSPSVEESPIAT